MTISSRVPLGGGLQEIMLTVPLRTRTIQGNLQRQSILSVFDYHYKQPLEDFIQSRRS